MGSNLLEPFSHRFFEEFRYRFSISQEGPHFSVFREGHGNRFPSHNAGKGEPPVKEADENGQQVEARLPGFVPATPSEVHMPPGKAGRFING